MRRPKLRRRKDGTYYARLYVSSRKTGNGKRPMEVFAFDTKDRVKAEQLLSDRIALRNKRVARGEGASITLAALAQAYIDEERGGPREAATIEKLLVPEFGHLPAEGLKAEVWKTFQRKRTKAGISEATCGRDFTTLRAILNLGVEKEWLDRNPIPRGAVKFKKTKNRLIYFTPGEWRKFIATFDDEAGFRARVAKVRKFGPVKLGAQSAEPRRYGAGRNPDSEATGEQFAGFLETRPVFEALLLTGSRLGEIVGLTWQDVDLADGHVRIPQPKTEEPKEIPITPELRAVLVGQERGTGAARVFRRADGTPFATKEIQRAFKRAKRISGIRAILTPHSIRHTFASWLMMDGASLLDTSRLLGHSDVRMTQKYAHLSPDHLREAAGRIGKILGGRA